MAHTNSLSSKLSLKEAILININIMVGSGIFINTVLLAKNTGIMSGAIYLLNGMLVLPLILSMAALMRIHPQGGFYAFGEQEIGSFAGFLSAWSYFIGKLASAALMMHTAFLLAQTVVPLLASIPILALDIAGLILFTGLNLLHMNVSITVQSTAFIIKLMPIFFVVLSGLFLISTGSTAEQWIMPSSLNTLIQTMPLVLFTALGFEATLSLSSKIENPSVNGPRAILIAFGTVVGLSCLFQTLFYVALGTALAQFPNYLFAFPALVAQLSSNPHVLYYASSFFHLAIAASALGGSYSILFSTHWNLYAIAEKNMITGAHILTKLNKHAMPTMGILLQAIVCALYFVVTSGNQVPLQLAASFGCTIAYTISVLALICAQQKRNMDMSPWIAWCALLNCGLFMASGLYSLLSTTLASFTLFTVMLTIGIGMYAIKKP